MYGKLSEAVRRLVVGEGDVRGRLSWASEYLDMVSRDMLPPHLWEYWDSIQTDLHRFPAQDGRTATEMTLRRIRNSTGSKIAQRILSLSVELEAYCDSSRQNGS